MSADPRVLTPESRPAAPAPPQDGPGSDTVESYVQRAIRLGPPHGPDCPCFMDAVIRADIGHVPCIIDPWDLLDGRGIA